MSALNCKMLGKKGGILSGMSKFIGLITYYTKVGVRENYCCIFLEDL